MTRADLMRAAQSIPDLSSTERLVLSALAYWARGDPLTAWRPRNLLSAETGKDAKTVQRALTRLRALGYVSISQRARKGTALTVQLHPDTWPSPTPATTEGGGRPPAGTTEHLPPWVLTGQDHASPPWAW